MTVLVPTPLLFITARIEPCRSVSTGAVATVTATRQMSIFQALTPLCVDPALLFVVICQNGLEPRLLPRLCQGSATALLMIRCEFEDRSTGAVQLSRRPTYQGAVCQNSHRARLS